jgi:hypothetical protein
MTKIAILNNNKVKVVLSFIIILTILFNYEKINVTERDIVVDSSKIILPKINQRFELGYTMQSFNRKVMIEIGVRSGVFAAEILSRWPSFEAYYGIDPWKYQKDGYYDHSNVDDATHEKNYLKAKGYLKQYGDKINFIRNFSSSVVHLFQENSIDLIYLDSKHDYCSVFEDLTNYYPKLKCGGVMAGHDYVTAAEATKHKWDICSNGTKVLINGGGPKGVQLLI